MAQAGLAAARRSRADRVSAIPGSGQPCASDTLGAQPDLPVSRRISDALDDPKGHISEGVVGPDALAINADP